VIYLRIFAEYCYIGFFSVGGGLATLPFIYRLADKYDWLSPEMVGNIQAVAQSAPGAVGVNMAAQVGFYGAGIGGAFLAALGLVSPSIIVILIVARMFRAFRQNPLVNALFSGLRPASLALLAAAGFGAIKGSLWALTGGAWYTWLKWRETLIFVLFFLLISRSRKHLVVYIAAAGLAGIVLGL
jgi:chromate transporter